MNSGCRAISDSGRPGLCARSSRGIGGGDLSCVSTRPASAASADCAMKVAANRYGSHQSLVTITTRGADDAGHHAAGQHQGDRLGLVGVAGGVGQRRTDRNCARRRRSRSRTCRPETAGTSPGAPRRRRSGRPAFRPPSRSARRSGGRSSAPDSRCGSVPNQMPNTMTDTGSVASPGPRRAWCRRCRRSRRSRCCCRRRAPARPPAPALALGEAVVGNDRRDIGDHRHRANPGGQSSKAPVLPGAPPDDHGRWPQIRSAARPGCRTLTLRASAGDSARRSGRAPTAIRRSADR